MKSESINELATALSKAQSEMTGAKKTSENPFFKSSYADLASVWETARIPLSKHGLSVTQTTELLPFANESRLVLTTTLLHTSGQWIDGSYPITPIKNDPQSTGSAITYARRYALMAIIGIAPSDDDGNDASAGGGHRKQDGATSRPPYNAGNSGGQTSQDSLPSQADYAKANPNWGKEKVTEKQLARMHAIMNSRQVDAQFVKGFCQERFKKDSSKDLTKGEYNVVIDWIERKENQS